MISEKKLAYPFDLNHIKITSYTHLGDAIDYDEVMRFHEALGGTIDAILQDQNTDSPVYIHVPEPAHPSLARQTNCRGDGASWTRLGTGGRGPRLGPG